MRKCLTIVVALGLAVSLVGCVSQTPVSGGSPHQGTPPIGEPSAGAPSGGEPAAVPSAQVVWSETIEAKVYQGWKPAPGFEAKQPAKGPHGKEVQVFVNPPVVETLNGTSASEWPVGSVIVKDAYDASGNPESVEYMKKSGEGWYFAAFRVDGEVIAEGVEIEPCQACHVKGSDSLMSVRLP